MNITGLSTGFAKLDEKIMGLKPGEITIIASRPSVGKTTLAMNIVECVALGQDINGDAATYDGGKHHPALLFSLEMPANTLIGHMLASRSRIDLWKINGDDAIDGDDDIDKERCEMKSRLVDARDALRHAPIFIEDCESALDVSVIRDKALKAKSLHNIELVVIDYLQLIENRGIAAHGRVEELQSIVTGIKELADELRVHVILLAQLHYSMPRGVDKKPTFSDFRDIPGAEQIADIVMFLLRPHYVNGEVNKGGELTFVNIAKNRHGETGEVSLKFRHKCLRFFEET